MNEKDSFTEEEKEVLRKYFEEQKSIREISRTIKGFGRTRINNLINRYTLLYPEYLEKAKIAKITARIHKRVDTADEQTQDELSEEQIKSAYKDIIERRITLTEASRELGKNRDTVRNAIIDYLDDSEDVREFERVLKDNQKRIANEALEKREFFRALSDEEKKERIFERLNNRRKIRGRDKYSNGFLERKFRRVMDYLYEKRNSRILDSKDKLSREEIFEMMFEFPELLSISLTNKVKPMLNSLDFKYLGVSDTTRVLKENPSILATSITRTRLQMKILKSTDTLKYAVKKPRTFRTSPELMYALIEKAREGNTTVSPFITKGRIESRYGMTADELMKRYDIREKYGDDEYFDGR